MPEPFTAWLAAHSYRSSTVSASLRTIARLRVTYASTGRVDSTTTQEWHVLRRYCTFLEDDGVRSDFDSAVAAEIRPLEKNFHGGPKRRQQTHQSFSDTDWKKLCRAVAEDPRRPAVVVNVMLATGYRVGDILRIKRAQLHRAFRTGILFLEVKGGHERQLPLHGVQHVWERLRDRWDKGETLAQWVAPRGNGQVEGGAAYQSVRRYMVKISKELDLDGRIHTHRIRRTVATRALTYTQDIHLVAQLLGHSSVQATERYLDETRLKDIGDLQTGLQVPINVVAPESEM